MCFIERIVQPADLSKGVIARIVDVAGSFGGSGEGKGKEVDVEYEVFGGGEGEEGGVRVKMGGRGWSAGDAGRR